MNLFRSYAKYEHPSTRPYVPYWLTARREAHVSFGGKQAMVKAAKRGWKRAVQSRRVEMMLEGI